MSVENRLDSSCSIQIKIDFAEVEGCPTIQVYSQGFKGLLNDI